MSVFEHHGERSVEGAVVVVGGGVMGTSTAYHLARAGVRDVILLEAGELAGGSSGKPLGGVRAQFSDPANIALGRRSFEAFRRFGSEVGTDIGLQQVGYLFALRDEADVEPFQRSIALQNELGVPSRMLGPAEAKRLCPYLDDATVLAAAWSSEAGFARPVDVVRGYARAAEAMGVLVRTSARVVDMAVAADSRAELSTADGSRYLAPAVVCAAGAWSGPLATMVGIDLPIVPVRRQIAFTPPVPRRPPRLPFTIDYTTTAYFHGSEDGGLLLGWADPQQQAGLEREVTTDWHRPLRDALSRFAPELSEVPISHGWAGLYEVTPDCNALIGEADAGFRFLYAAGFSGHGFLQGPAVGESVADLYLGRPTPVDLRCFDAGRFSRPTVRTELGII
jgi:sarcosine oxidase subunit beta